VGLKSASLATVLNITLASSHGTCRTETFSRSNVGHKAQGAFLWRSDGFGAAAVHEHQSLLFFPLG